MEQEKRLDYLLDYLAHDYASKNEIAKPTEYTEKRALFRALVNVRSPRPVPSDFLHIQDTFLQEEARLKGIMTLDEIPPCAKSDRISLWQGDITRLAVDAIVNAANSEMLGCFHPGHRCIDNEIHTASGVQLREECSRIMEQQDHPEETGQAKITSAYNLPSKYIIHTVGPIVNGCVTAKKKEQLQSCYTSCLNTARKKGDIHSIAFCCISTGEYRFPQKEAAKIAVGTVLEWFEHNSVDMNVVFNVFKDSDLEVYQSLLN